jgi:hypothetical protein
MFTAMTQPVLTCHVLGHDEHPKVTSLHLHMISIPSPQSRRIAGQGRLAVSAAGLSRPGEIGRWVRG